MSTTIQILTLSKMDYEGFKTFLRREIDQRKISITEFAGLVGVSHTTILRFVTDNPNKVYIPTLELLDKVSAATGINLITILSICFPETARKLEIDPEVNLICESVTRLSAEGRRAVLKFIRSFDE